MSSMFKKKGALAFKPKIPSARPRPAAASSSNITASTAIDATSHETVTKSIEAESQNDVTIVAPVERVQDRTDETRQANISSTEQEGEERQERKEEVLPRARARASEAVQPALISPTAEKYTQQSSDSITTQQESPSPRILRRTRTSAPEPQHSAPSAASARKTRSKIDLDVAVDVVADAEPRLEPSYRHQNPTPPPSINESLIAPELRDKPTASTESHELASLIEPADPEARQEFPSPDAESHPAKPAKKPAAPRTRARRKAADTSEKQQPDSNGGEDDAEAASRLRKRQRKAPAQDATDEQQQEGAEPAPAPKRARQRKLATTSRASSARPGKRARSLTPDDAETQTVDLQKLKMTDLTKDLHIGKKFSRHDELRDRERQARLRAKLKGSSASRSASETPDDPGSSHPSASETKLDSATPGVTSAPTPTPTPTPTAPGAGAGAGPQFRIVDGQITIDQSSLVMDRHARAAAARGAMETVEENDFTRLITSNSFMATSKLRGPNIWTDEETELFYRGLRMFGTEFEMISRMFPNKQRRHVKLKYNREERHCPERITATICGVKTDKIDIDEYKLFTGMEFETVESIEAEHRLIREGFEAEQQRAADEQAEVMRRKREELFADEDDAAAAAADGKMKKKGKKKGKQAIAYGLNGVPIVTES